jgi:melibiose permease/lactose/raffinose/galactose permease
MAMLVMLTNTIEYDEWKTGERKEAVIFSVRPFMVKLSSAIQTGIVSLTLIVCGLYDYTKEVGDLEILKNKDGSTMTDTEILEQATEILSKANDTQLFGLSIAMTIIPILLFIGTYLIIKKKYIIDEVLYDQMIKEIEERKNNQQ